MLQFWFPKNEFFKFLQPMMGYSEFCRRWILKGIETEFSDQFIIDLINKKEIELKNLKEKRKQQKLISTKAIEVLQLWYQTYTSAHRPAVDNSKNLFWIKEKIIPALKEAGCTAFDKNQILDIFKEHHRTGKVK